MRTKELFAWIKERHLIYQRKLNREPKPWTQDPILQQYRFCNVYRELDTVTQWIAKNWRQPHAKDPDLWFAMVVARLFNWPNTLATIGYPVPFDAKAIRKSVNRLKAFDGKVFSGAYIVSTNGHAMDKVDYLLKRVLGPLWKDRWQISHLLGTQNVTLAEIHKVLMAYDGLGSFMAAQVIADIKYVKPWSNAADWHTWAASGPGSRRGLNRVVDDAPINSPWREEWWLAELQRLHTEINVLVKRAAMPQLHAQDLQNCLCEFDKYERTRLGEGRPRSTYPGG